MDPTIVGFLIGIFLMVMGMGYVPEMAVHGKPAPTGQPPLNLDRFGMPRDYATYMWLTYKRRVTDESPARLAFLSSRVSTFPDYMGAVMRRRYLELPEPDEDLIGTQYR